MWGWSGRRNTFNIPPNSHDIDYRMRGVFRTNLIISKVKWLMRMIGVSTFICFVTLWKKDRVRNRWKYAYNVGYHMSDYIDERTKSTYQSQLQWVRFATVLFFCSKYERDWIWERLGQRMRYLGYITAENLFRMCFVFDPVSGWPSIMLYLRRIPI